MQDLIAARTLEVAPEPLGPIGRLLRVARRRVLALTSEVLRKRASIPGGRLHLLTGLGGALFHLLANLLACLSDSLLGLLGHLLGLLLDLLLGLTGLVVVSGLRIRPGVDRPFHTVSSALDCRCAIHLRLPISQRANPRSG